MITNGLLCKQIITPISSDNINKFMVSSSEDIAGPNYTLKSIKSDNIIDFIQVNHCSLIITSNKVVFPSDLNVVKNYIKNSNYLDSSDIQSGRLPQSKSYLKILGILYIIESTNILINSSIMELIIKSTYIFDNIHIALKLYIIKVSPKSDMSIVWIDIQDSQSSTSTKTLIN